MNEEPEDIVVFKDPDPKEKLVKDQPVVDWDTPEPERKTASKQKARDNPKSQSVWSEIPWEKYLDRITFTGKIPRGSKTIVRSLSLDAQELRIAEIIMTEARDRFQTVSDVLRDVIRKGLMVDYELLVRRKEKVKHRGEAAYLELSMVDEELAILAVIDAVEKRVLNVLKECVKGVAGRDRKWGEKTIEDLILAAENDFPGRGIKEYFHSFLYEQEGSRRNEAVIKRFHKANESE